MVSATKSKIPLPPPPPESGETTVTPPAVVKNNPPTPSKPFSVRMIQPGESGAAICLYGPPGSGKSTLASLAPDPVFIDLNHGLSGLNVAVVNASISTYEMLCEVVRAAPSFVTEGGTLVIDTATEIDDLICEYLKRTYGKKSVKELSYDRFSCAVEAFRLLLSDLDRVIAARRNVVLLAHEQTSNYKNALGDDYRVLGPKMTHSQNDSCRDALAAWCGHVFRVALIEPTVKIEMDASGKKIASRKVVNGSSERYITTQGTQSIIAKSRRVLVKGQSLQLPNPISFSDPEDDSLWEGLRNPAIFGMPA